MLWHLAVVILSFLCIRGQFSNKEALTDCKNEGLTVNNDIFSSNVSPMKVLNENDYVKICFSKSASDVIIQIDFPFIAFLIEVELNSNALHTAVLHYNRFAENDSIESWELHGKRQLKLISGTNFLNPFIIANHLRLHFQDVSKASCFQLKFSGCVFKAQIVSYTMPLISSKLKGDATYDGFIDDSYHGGLGFLTNLIVPPLDSSENSGWCVFDWHKNGLNFTFDFFSFRNMHNVTFIFKDDPSIHLTVPKRMSCWVTYNSLFALAEPDQIYYNMRAQSHLHLKSLTVNLDAIAKSITCNVKSAGKIAVGEVVINSGDVSNEVITTFEKDVFNKLHNAHQDLNSSDFNTGYDSLKPSPIVRRASDLGNSDDVLISNMNGNKNNFSITLSLILLVAFALVTVLLFFGICVVLVLMYSLCKPTKPMDNASVLYKQRPDPYYSSSATTEERLRMLNMTQSALDMYETPRYPIKPHDTYYGRQLPDVPSLDSVLGSKSPFGGDRPDLLPLSQGNHNNVRGPYAETDLNNLQNVVEGGIFGGVYDTGLTEYSMDDLRFVRVIGKGQSAEVHLCMAPSTPTDTSHSRKVAAKVYNNCVTPELRNAFMKEVKIIKDLTHPNLIKLLGVMTTGPRWMMILEYMENGDLYQFLRLYEATDSLDSNSNIKTLSYAMLLNIIKQVAAGMSHLEEKQFVHRDLATRNCLVGINYEVKIGDFGMSRELYKSDYYTMDGKQILPIRWMSWEPIYLGKFTSKSDVWAFGILMWEVITFAKKPPYSDLEDQEVVNNLGKFFQKDQGIVPEKPNNCPENLYQLMLKCWQIEGSDRPSFQELHLAVIDLYEQETRVA